MPRNVLFQLNLATRDGSKRTCTICNKWKENWTSANIMSHFKHNHPTEYAKAIKEQKRQKQQRNTEKHTPSKRQRIDDDDKSQITETSSTVSSLQRILSSPIKSSSIIDHIAKANSSVILDKITLAFVMNNIPHHIINNTYFIDMLKSIISCGQGVKLPERHKLKEHVIQLGLQTQKVGTCADSCYI